MSEPLTTDLVESRLRLFAFAGSPDRILYLWLLRVFEEARERYAHQLRLTEVAGDFEALARAHPDLPEATNLQGSLDQMVDWGLLARTQDGSHVRSIAEYRQRRSTYQLTPLGWQSYRAVEQVLGAQEVDAELRRLVFPSALRDLEALREANLKGEGGEVGILLSRLHQTLEDLATRASRFYLLFAELARVHEVRPEAFLAHKDRLLVHLQEFMGELQRYRPRLSAAVRGVEETGVDALLARAAAEEPGVFGSDEERRARWARHWEGIRTWFVDGPQAPSAATRLDTQTAVAIRELAGLLRGLSEIRYGGVSRAAQLESLGAWFMDTPSEEAAHALFDVTFRLTPPRHLSVVSDGDDSAPPQTPWWEGPRAEVSTTLRQYGRVGSAGRPAPIRENAAAQRIARERQRASRDKRRAAEAGLSAGLGQRPLTRGELAALLRLLNVALQQRRSAPDSAIGALVARSRQGAVTLTLRRAQGESVIRTESGTLTLPALSLELVDTSTSEGR